MSVTACLVVTLAVQSFHFKHTLTRPASSSFGPITRAAGVIKVAMCKRPFRRLRLGDSAPIISNFVPYGMLLDSHA